VNFRINTVRPEDHPFTSRLIPLNTNINPRFIRYNKWGKVLHLLDYLWSLSFTSLTIWKWWFRLSMLSNACASLLLVAAGTLEYSDLSKHSSVPAAIKLLVHTNTYGGEGEGLCVVEFCILSILKKLCSLPTFDSSKSI
jgi:hypothetical protein